MLPSRLLKYILDIESVVSEIEQVCNRYDNDFNTFKNDFMATRTIERDLEIIGEAINKMLQIDPELKISGTKHIVGLRNLIVHSYDTVDAAILWGIIQKDIPVLKQEIRKLKE